MYSSYKDIIDYFSRITAENRVPHALLLLGPEGSGQLRATMEWCKMLLCTERTDGTYCGSCKSCQKVERLNHPDIHFAYPVIKHEQFKREDTTSTQFSAEWRQFLGENIHGNITDWLSAINGLNKTANINVAECNQIIHQLGLKTYEGKYKIQIIWHAESLAKEGNRLLKLIEEPSDDTIIILIAHNHNAILNTIQSRCQIVRVPAYTDDELLALLEGESQATESELREICYLASGDLRKAMALLKHSKQSHSADMLDWFRRSYKADPEELIAIVDHLNGYERESLKAFFRYILHFLREYLVAYHSQSTEGLRLSQEEKSVVLKMQKILDIEKSGQLQELINRNISYIDRNLSIRIMLMNMSFKINEILKAEVNKFA